MAVDMRVTIDGEVIEYDTDEVLSDLTGDETIACEDFLGGWDKFRADGNATRSLVVLVWLAKRTQGSNATLQDVAKEKGILFGDRVDIDDLDEDGNPIQRDAEGNPIRPPAGRPDGGETRSTESGTSDTSGTGASPSDTE